MQNKTLSHPFFKKANKGSDFSRIKKIKQRCGNARCFIFNGWVARRGIEPLFQE